VLLIEREREIERESCNGMSNQSNQIFICSNETSEKIDNNSDNEQDSKAQEALTAALVNNSKISTRNS